MKQADLSLGKGELQTFLDYSIVGSADQVAADMRPIIEMICPGSQLEIYRAIAITNEEASRSRMCFMPANRVGKDRSVRCSPCLRALREE